MARLIPGTAEYTAAFGAQLEIPTFTSELPEYYAITQAWADPALRVDLGLDRLDGMNAKIAHDIQAGGRRMVWSLAVPGDANLPLQLFSAVRELVFSRAISQNLSELQVLEIFDPTKRPPGAPGIAGVFIGAALAAVGCAVPIVGQIAGALVAFASLIYRRLNKNKIAQDLQDEKVRQELYKSFPPLAVADSATDTQIVRRLHAMAETGDLTDIFMPRFKGEWVGIERAKGFAFAPGSTTVDSDVFGEDVQQFEAAGGIGCIPNTGIITSVIQVSLDPQGPEFKRFQKASIPDPRILEGAHERVIDTGTFYKATSDQASLVWSTATEDRGLQGNPLLYRLNPQRMADAWQQYFESGLDYIRKKAFGWWGSVVAGDGSIDKNADLEGFFAPAVFHAVGAFSGRISGGTTMHPIWSLWDKPYGVYRDEMKQSGLYKFSEYAGTFLPIMDTPKPGFDQSMGSQWDRGPNVKLTCETVAKQQQHDLQYTLVSLYVRRTDGAFVKNPKLVEFLDAKRRTLLTGQSDALRDARRRAVWPDIPETETLDGESLRALALKAGIPQVPKPQVLAGNDMRAPVPRPALADFQLPLGTRPHNYGRALAVFGSALALGTAAWQINRSRSYARRGA